MTVKTDKANPPKLPKPGMTAEQTSSKAINTLIASVKTNFTKANDSVQTAIVAVITHASIYGDCTGAARLVEAMPKSVRRAAVIDHFTDYSPIRVALTDKKIFNATLRKPDDKAFKDFNIDGAKANRWDERKSLDKDPEIVNLVNFKAKLYALLTTYETKAKALIEAGNDDGQSIAETIKKVRAAA